MEQSAKESLVLNASNAWRMASNWAMATAGTVFAIYLSLPAEQQKTIIEHLPVPPWVMPIAATVLGIVARIWPQKSVDKALGKTAEDGEAKP